MGFISRISDRLEEYWRVVVRVRVSMYGCGWHELNLPIQHVLICFHLIKKIDSPNLSKFQP